MSEYENDSTQFQKCDYPATWGYPYEMTRQIVAPMHTIALCMQKNTVTLTLDFASLWNKKSSFMSQMNDVLDYIADMKLDWCKVFSVETDKFGGWVSENWCSLGRIMKWVYSAFDNIIESDEYEEPKKNVKYWTTKECDQYLRHYGLKTNGKAEERRNLVQKVYFDDSVPKLSFEERYGSTKQVQQVVESLSAVLSHIMSPDVDEKIIHESDRHIRIFLHNLEILDEVINKDRKKSKLQSSYSFLASLQLVDVMREHGSLRNVWEGTYIGEGILAKVKPLITDLHTNWHINAGRKYNRMKILNKILLQYVSESEKASLLGRNYCTYINDSHARDLFNNQKPLSVLCLNNGEYITVLSCNRMIKLVHKSFCTTIFGLAYFHWQLNEKDDENIFTYASVRHYCILLPCMIKSDYVISYNCGIYGVITSEWMEMNEKGDISTSTILEANYSSS